MPPQPYKGGIIKSILQMSLSDAQVFGLNHYTMHLIHSLLANQVNVSGIAWTLGTLELRIDKVPVLMEFLVTSKNISTSGSSKVL